MPFVNIKTPNVRVAVNFGQKPFTFDVSNPILRDQIIKDQKEVTSKLKREQEEKQKAEQDRKASILQARKEQALTLQGFVGQPINFCMVALEKTNDNLELAAEWVSILQVTSHRLQAMLNAEAYQADHPELFEDNEQQQNEVTEVEEETSEPIYDSLIFNLGYTYSLPLERATNQESTASNSRLDIKSLRLGQTLRVCKNVVKGRSWIPRMDRTTGRTGIVKVGTHLP
jgi:hypothetical protein